MLATTIRSTLSGRLNLLLPAISVNAYHIKNKTYLNVVDKKPVKNKASTFRMSSLNDGRGGVTRSFNIPDNRNSKKFIYHGRSNDFMHGIKETENDLNPEELFEIEKDLDTFASNENAFHDKIIEEDIKKRRSIKLAIIKKKMKRLSGEKHTYFNLLTWDAKEQIKHLNLEDPEQWTPEKIADSYPIELENVKKLLRSKWSPRTLEDLAKHDEKVIKNWQTLAESVGSGETLGPAVNLYEDMIKSNRIALMKYACGLPGVEFERSKIIASDSFAIHESVLAKPGKFSSLIKRDDRVEKLFKKEVNSSGLITMGSNGESSVETHFATTRSELAKSLSRMFSGDIKKEVQKKDTLSSDQGRRRAQRAQI